MRHDVTERLYTRFGRHIGLSELFSGLNRYVCSGVRVMVSCLLRLDFCRSSYEKWRSLGASGEFHVMHRLKVMGIGVKCVRNVKRCRLLFWKTYKEDSA